MKSIEITEPVPCPKAFHEISELGEYSRAAFLLSLGTLLNPPSNEFLEDLIKTAPFPLPKIAPLSTRTTTHEILNIFRKQNFTLDNFSDKEGLINEYASELVKHIYTVPLEKQLLTAEEQWSSLFQLLGIFLRHPNELLRVSATISFLDIVSNGAEFLWFLETIVSTSEYDLVRDMAYTALKRIKGRDKVFKGIKEPNLGPQPHVSTADSFIVHGTIFSHPGKPYEKWWEPNTGDFHNYLKNGPRPNVYAGIDYFSWSGGWNDYARNEGVKKLIRWIDKHNMQGTDVFAHSHGCNVTMLASKYRRLGTLVLMSCPVHWNLFKPNFNKVDKVLSIRIKWDFVIMADKGGQRFRDSRISETVLPFWFTAHDVPRKSKTWLNQKLDQLL